MNEITVFNNDEFGSIRTVTIESEPWFVGKDVAEVLGYQNGSRDINRHVDDEDKLCTKIEYAGQKREVTIINESGLYSLILSSKLPNAKKFKRWVTSEVLPSIRKTGSYGKPMSQLEIAQYSINLLIEQERKMKALEAQQGGAGKAT